MANKISYADLMLAVNGTRLVKIQAISAQSSTNSIIDSFDIDPFKILQTSNIKNEVFYSMRLIPKAGESRHYFYNLYFKKDSLGRITKTIVKIFPTIETIKNGYKNFKGKYEFLKELQTSTSQIRSSSTDLKPQVVCYEVAFDIPCEYGFVHPEGDGLGSWCDGSGSRRDYMNDCTSGGGSGSGTTGSGSPSNGGGTNVLITPNANLNIIVCENSEADNFIVNTYNANKTWADSHLTEFNQAVGSICGNYSEDKKENITTLLKFLQNQNYIDEEDFLDDDTNIPMPNDTTELLPDSIILYNGKVISVTYGNTDDGVNSKLQVSKRVLVALKQALELVNIYEDIYSINISASTNGKHTSKSDHYKKLALDISKINGKYIILTGPNSKVVRLQQAFEVVPNRRENFGPFLKLRLGQPINVSKHHDHIHFSVTGQ